MKTMRILSFPLVLFLAVSIAGAQKSSKKTVTSDHKLISVTVTGTERYSDKEIVAGSGLEIGRDAGDPDFKEAVRRLGDSGVFTEVSYSFTYSPAGTKLEMHLADAGKKNLVPAHFENFVWFTDTELRDELKRRVPLFKPELPVSGSLPDDVSQALQEMLNAKQIPGQVDYLRETPQEGGEMTAMAYRVEAMSITIEQVDFPGAGPNELPRLRANAQKLVGAHYFRSSLEKVAEVDFLPVYLQRGFLKASFAPSEARVLKQNEGEVLVEAQFPVTPGKIYSVSSVEWSGNSAVSTAQLQPLLHLIVGQPADAIRLGRDLEAVNRVYHSKGYMAAQIRPDAEMNDEKSSVGYTLHVSEGDQYKMGDLELLGLDPQSIARLQEVWDLHSGDPYNADYPNKFLDANTKLLPGGVRWGINVHETINEKDKTVDLTIRFTPRA